MAAPSYGGPSLVTSM